MSTALVLQHVPFEGPSRLRGVLERHGFSVEVRHLYASDSVPQYVPRDAVLVIMGGPMGVGDIGQAACSFLRDEVRLLEQRVRDDAPTLGICLGAQLMAHATGARVYPNLRATAGRVPEPVREVGWAEVEFLHESADPALRGLSERETMFHWHGDTFELPRDSVLLASTSRCKHQAFRLRTRLFGLQFHAEVEPSDIEGLLAADEAYALAANGPDAAVTMRTETHHYAERYAMVGDRLLTNIVREMIRCGG